MPSERVMIKTLSMCFIFAVVKTTDLIEIIKLVGGSSPYEGTVLIHIWYGYSWYGSYMYELGTICDDDFVTNEARVVCRMLGYEKTYAYAYGDAKYGDNNRNIVLDNVKCEGYESTLVHCSYTILPNHNCVPYEAVGVLCRDTLPLKYILGITFGCLSCVMFGIVGVIVYVKRRRQPKKINCVTAPLGATTWDLLVVVDAKDAIMELTERLMGALGTLTPTRQIKRTNIHRLYIEKNTVKCKRAVFFICKGCTSVEDCVGKLLPKLTIKRNVSPKIKLFTSDMHSQHFENVDITNNNCNTSIASELSEGANELTWLIHFVSMYFKIRRSKKVYFDLTIDGESGDKNVAFQKTILVYLKAFGVNPVERAKTSSFRLIIADTFTELDSLSVPFALQGRDQVYGFVNKVTIPSEALRSTRPSRCYDKRKLIMGILHILADCRIINAKVKTQDLHV